MQTTKLMIEHPIAYQGDGKGFINVEEESLGQAVTGAPVTANGTTQSLADQLAYLKSHATAMAIALGA